MHIQLFHLSVHFGSVDCVAICLATKLYIPHHNETDPLPKHRPLRIYLQQSKMYTYFIVIV